MFVCVVFSNEGEFDDMVTAPVFGFDGSRDYYEKSQAGQFLKGVRVPLLVVQVRLLLSPPLALLQQQYQDMSYHGTSADSIRGETHKLCRKKW